MVFQHLAEDSDNEYQMLDATIVRAHQHSAGAKNSDKKTNVLVQQAKLASVARTNAKHSVLQSKTMARTRRT